MTATASEPLLSEDALVAWYEQRNILTTRIREQVTLSVDEVLDGTRESIRDELARRTVGSIWLTDMTFSPVRANSKSIEFEVCGDITELIRRIRVKQQAIEDTRDVRKDDRPCQHDGCPNLLLPDAPEDVVYCGRRDCAGRNFTQNMVGYSRQHFEQRWKSVPPHIVPPGEQRLGARRGTAMCGVNVSLGGPWQDFMDERACKRCLDIRSKRDAA